MTLPRVLVTAAVMLADKSQRPGARIPVRAMGCWLLPRLSLLGLSSLLLLRIRTAEPKSGTAS